MLVIITPVNFVRTLLFTIKKPLIPNSDEKYPHSIYCRKINQNRTVLSYLCNLKAEFACETRQQNFTWSVNYYSICEAVLTSSPSLPPFLLSLLEELCELIIKTHTLQIEVGKERMRRKTM